jgi:putative oxidoreductase
MKTLPTIAYWAARIVAAVIMLQTLFFKFTGAAESIRIFTTVGMEPWGRFAVGTLELIAAVMILINTTAWLGAALGFGLMAGAIFMHLTLLGIVVDNDGGQLFIYAVIVLLCCAYVLFVNKARIMMTLRPHH